MDTPLHRSLAKRRRMLIPDPSGRLLALSCLPFLLARIARLFAGQCRLITAARSTWTSLQRRRHLVM